MNQCIRFGLIVAMIGAALLGAPPSRAAHDEQRARLFDALQSLANGNEQAQGRAGSKFGAVTRWFGGSGRKQEPLRHLVAAVHYGPLGLEWSAALGFVDGTSGTRARPDNTFRIASLTKTFTAVAVMKLVETGRFGIDDPISSLLSPQSADLLRNAGADPATITVRQLLGHRSGLFDYAQTREYFEAVLADPRKRWSRLEQLELAVTLNAPIAPDQAFIYADTNYIVLGEILERATGVSLASALRETLDYRAVGLRHTYLESLEAIPPDTRERLHQFAEGVDTIDFDPSFDLWGGGGLVSTVDDLRLFYRALFRGQIIAPATLETMIDARAGGGFGESAYALGMEAFYIGNHACFGHTGFFGSMAAHCPDIDFTFAVSVGNNRFPGIAFNPKGFGQALAVALGIDTRARPFGRAFRLTRCPPEIDVPAVRLRCGMTAVPESRGQRHSKVIELATILAQHPDVPATLDPLLLLGGGPGEPLFADLLPLFATPELLQTLVTDQDIVFVEQRGVGASVPALNCDRAFGTPEGASPCIEKFRALGVDLTRYNSIESAADVDDLRRTLRHARWNVLGFSYGTRLALTMLRERPRTIRSLVLDGAFPPEASDEQNPPLLAAVLDDVFAACTADTACDRAFPYLRMRFVATLDELNADPITVNGNTLNGDYLVLALANFQLSPEAVTYLPAVMDAMARRDETFLNAVAPPSDPAAPLPDFASTAMFYSVTCNEEAPFVDRASLQAMAAGADPIIAAYARNALNTAAICDLWPAGTAPVREAQPVDARVPTLIFNGAYDLQTPPQAGRELAARIATAQGVDFPANGHIATRQSPECALSLIFQLQRMDQAAVDTSCAAALPPPRWKTALDEAFYAGFSRSD
jgi:D-alanyl-D-alanine carboxypeptidase